MNLQFEYFYGSEAEQFAFYRIPKSLMTDPQFAGVSLMAKLLYGLLLDRTYLSVENGWFDDQGRAYIHFSIEDIAHEMHCGKTKAVALLNELDSVKGIGLVEKVRMGQGNASRLYVKKFYSSEVQNVKFKNSEKRNSRSSENETLEFQNMKPNNTEKNKTERITKENIQRKSYGSYGNVLLSDDDYRKLTEEFPSDYQDRIESVSLYCASHGKKYKDFLATIRSWARKDIPKTPSRPRDYSFEEGDCL